MFDAEGLKIITEITSDARRKVHETEKRTTVAIRQKDLDTQLELLEIEKNEAFARAGQDKSVSNEQALQLGQKQMYVLDQRMAVEQKEIENEKELERLRTEREVAIIEEAQKREASEIQKDLALERERRDREIAIIAKAKQEELADIERKLELEKAERDRQIALVAKAEQQELAEIARELARESAEKEREIELTHLEKAREQAEIQRLTAVMEEEESARDMRHKAAEETALAMRKRSLDTRLAVLDLDKDEAVATVKQEQEVSNERARLLSEKQRFILEQRWIVQQEEISKEQAVEQARIGKEAAVIEESKRREAAEIRRALAREQEERDREIALVAKQEELERAEIRRDLAREQEDRDRQIALVAKDEELRTAEVRQTLAIEVQEREREIALIAKELERETADIRRFTSREKEERDREIALAQKTRELESAEAERLATTAERERAEHVAESVRVIADAEREKEVERLSAERTATAQRIQEEAKAEISRMHMVTQSEARNTAAANRRRRPPLPAPSAQSDAQKITAEGIEREAGAQGRAEMEIETLRVENTQRMLEAEAVGLEAKAGALKKYNDAATFLELAKLAHRGRARYSHRPGQGDGQRAAERANPHVWRRRWRGRHGRYDPRPVYQGLRARRSARGRRAILARGAYVNAFAANGLRGLFGRPYGTSSLKEAFEQLSVLVDQSMKIAQGARDPLDRGDGQT